MIALWNRREVFMGFDEKAFLQAREWLAQADIPYRYRVTTSSGLYRERTLVPPAWNPKTTCCYYLYVHKKDCSRAVQCLRHSGQPMEKQNGEMF